MSSRTAEHMKYPQRKKIVIERVLSHPAYGKEWKEFDKNFSDFAHEIRNVRLDLATDGFPSYSNAYFYCVLTWACCTTFVKPFTYHVHKGSIHVYDTTSTKAKWFWKEYECLSQAFD